jgi:hypothetical protein
VKRRLPAVVVYTEQFSKLAKAIMRAQNVPESIGILIKGNPEFISDEALMKVADEVAAGAIERLTTAHATAAKP